MERNDPFVEEIFKRLSTVRFCTVPEIRPDLPDLKWRELPPETAEEFGRVFCALNVLIASGEVEVRTRHVGSVFDRNGREIERRYRQEFKITLPPGGKKHKVETESVDLCTQAT